VGGWSIPCSDHFILGERDPVTFVEEAVLAPGLVWRAVENLAPTGIQSVALPAQSNSLY